MIRISCKQFISSSGEIQKEWIKEELQKTFAEDSKILLDETNKTYTIDNLNELITDISNVISKQIEIEHNRSMALWIWVALTMIWSISMFTESLCFDSDFERKYVREHNDSIYQIVREYHYFPLAYSEYKIIDMYGLKRTVGYKIFGINFTFD